MKKIFSLTAAFLMLFLCFVPAVSAENTAVAAVNGKPLLCDEADLFTPDEEAAILSLLEKNSAKAKMDIVIVTVNSTGEKSEQDYADDFYDYNGYGQGENKDGVLMLISMSPRYVHITGTGKCVNIFNSEQIDVLLDTFWDDLAADRFASAAKTYAEQSAKMISGFKMRKVILIPIALLLGFLLGSAKTNRAKAAHNSVFKKAGASDYAVAGSLSVRRSEDNFLYSNVMRSAKVEPARGGSSGGTHTSSSGTSHSGGGRSF